MAIANELFDELTDEEQAMFIDYIIACAYMLRDIGLDKEILHQLVNDIALNLSKNV